MSERKIWDPKYFNDAEAQLKSQQRGVYGGIPLFTALQNSRTGEYITELPDQSGLIQTNGPESKVYLKPAPGQKVIKKRNAYIVFGKDRPGGLETGWGGKGAINCDAIDIVVGRMSSLPRVNNARRGTIVDPNFAADAARIYISQLTDIDKNFGITEGIAGNVTTRSGIGIKADAVRIIGREGVKIVTGKAPFPGFGIFGETNALGGRIRQRAPKIELIAGNKSGERTVAGGEFLRREIIQDLQPAVRGENMVSALKELHGIIENMMSAIFNLAVVNTAFASAISVGPIPHYGIAGGATATQVLDSVVNNIWQQRINSNIWEANFVYPFSYRYVCSKNVFLT